MRASEPAVTVPTSNASICPGRFVSVGVVAVSDPKRSVPGRMGAGAALLTVTVTGADVVLLPAASRATAVKVCVPFVTVAEFQLTEYGAVGDDRGQLRLRAPRAAREPAVVAEVDVGVVPAERVQVVAAEEDLRRVRLHVDGRADVRPGPVQLLHDPDRAVDRGVADGAE